MSAIRDKWHDMTEGDLLDLDMLRGEIEELLAEPTVENMLMLAQYGVLAATHITKNSILNLEEMLVP